MLRWVVDRIGEHRAEQVVATGPEHRGIHTAAVHSRQAAPICAGGRELLAIRVCCRRRGACRPVEPATGSHRRIDTAWCSGHEHAGPPAQLTRGAAAWSGHRRSGRTATACAATAGSACTRATTARHRDGWRTDGQDRLGRGLLAARQRAGAQTQQQTDPQYVLVVHGNSRFHGSDPALPDRPGRPQHGGKVGGVPRSPTMEMSGGEHHAPPNSAPCRPVGACLRNISRGKPGTQPDWSAISSISTRAPSGRPAT
jgi:hypothetical protein